MKSDNNLNYLLEATVRRIESNLVEEAIISIRPKIVEKVKEAVKELEPTIRQYHKLMEDQLVFQLIVKEPK